MKQSRLAECPDCGHHVSLSARECPACGCPFGKKSKTGAGKATGCVGVTMAIGGAIPCFIGYAGNPKSAPNNVMFALGLIVMVAGLLVFAFGRILNWISE